MNNSKSDTQNSTKQHAGFASASAPSSEQANKSNGADSESQNPGSTLAKDKDLSQQDVHSQKTQSEKTDAASSEKTGSGKGATTDESSQGSDGMTPGSKGGSNTGKTGEASPSLSASSKL